MLFVLYVVGPVFLLVAVGYVSVRVRLFPQEGIDSLLYFVITFGAPCLLFQAMVSVDFKTVFDPEFLLSFYLGAFVVFAGAMVLAIAVFERSPGEAVVVGFATFFSNSILLGLPIIQRAYGDDALPPAYAIVGLHAPLLITVGMLAMEMARRDGAPIGLALRQAGLRIVRNPLLIGIGLGLAVNVSGLPLPEILDDATKMMASIVLPTALFGLGGALNQYGLRDSYGPALLASGLKLAVHPAVVLILARGVFEISWDLTLVAVLMAAMPSGLNAYVFANTYNRSTDVAANTILISTLVAVLSVSAWLLVLEAVKP